MLERWLSPRWLDPSRLAEDARACAHGRWLVVDGLLREEALARIDADFARRRFAPDNEGLPYDSTSSRVAPDDALAELFYAPAWMRWLHRALDEPEPEVCALTVAARIHPPDARGFWPHVDDLPGIPRRLAVLLYLDPGWRAADGGLLQRWQALPTRPGDEPMRWADREREHLGFLEERRELVLELGGPWNLPVTRLRLLDQVVPERNRAVLIGLHPQQAVHSVTPSHGRARRAVLQWVA
ncbi:MAG: hypothetical protein H6739_39555 [Alphaproteobacteria bacterium]|nr:hypothetical protein [Alphaproteobacteria bacterium]